VPQAGVLAGPDPVLDAGVRPVPGFQVGAWLDNTGEALAALLRPGNADSNTAADHLTVVDWALAQLPDRWRSKPILSGRPLRVLVVKA